MRMGMIQEQLSALEHYGREHHIPIIGEAGGRLLSQTVGRCRPQSVLEIGTAIGYSTLLIAAQLPPTATITTLEIDRERAQIAHDVFCKLGMANQIRVLVGDAGQRLTQMDDSFDFVFIDAAKGQYPDYLRKIRRLLTPGGTIVADNVLFRGMVLAEQPTPRRYRTIVRRLQEYLELVTTDPLLQTELHHLGDGMAISYEQGEKYNHEKT